MPVEAWARMAGALDESPAPEDRELARAVKGFLGRMPTALAVLRTLPATKQREVPSMERTLQVHERTRPGPEMEL